MKAPNAVLVALTALAAPHTTHSVKCDAALKCSEKHRENCDDFFPNACGNCIAGMIGGDGPLNTVCIGNASCALIYPGQTGCSTASSSPKVPFVVHFGRCVCDTAGRQWPTAPGMCSKVDVDRASGKISLHLCKAASASRPACEPASCSRLAEWLPGTDSCKWRGSDAFLLSDECTVLDSILPVEVGPSPLCGHDGLLARLDGTLAENEPAAKHLAERPLVCELAPRCPESVQGKTRLDQSCCYGTPTSHPLTEWGKNVNLQAPGFCSVLPTQPPPVQNSTSRASEAHPGPSQVCAVRVAAPGWQGCACLGPRGIPIAGRVCTVDCVPPDCPLPPGGIAPPLQEWLTSEATFQTVLPANRNRWMRVGSQALPSASISFVQWLITLSLAILVDIGVLH